MESPVKMGGFITLLEKFPTVSHLHLISEDSPWLWVGRGLIAYEWGEGGQTG